MLSEMILKNTGEFPPGEDVGLKAQMQRAAMSIPLNVAEGRTRSHGDRFIQFLSIALGSLEEVKTQVELPPRFKFIS